MYIMTAHKTFLARDHSGALVNAKFEEGNELSFIKIDSLDDDEISRATGQAATSVERSSTGFFLKANGQYISAIPDGSVEGNRTVPEGWETFTTVNNLSPKFSVSYLSFESDMARFRDEVASLTASGKPVKIYCGAGAVPREGFLNLDIEMHAPNFAYEHPEQYFLFSFADTAWDIPDNSVDYIFHEDFIEHIPQVMQWQFLAECLRVLKPGTWHRVNTPNLLASMKRYSDFKAGLVGVYTGELDHGHIDLFTPSSLKEVAETIGYREVVFTTRHHGVSPYSEHDYRPGTDRDDVVGNIYADLLK